MPKPASDPMSPMITVSQAGIGSGPGTAKRASAPVTKAVSTIESAYDTCGSVARHDHGMTSTPAAPFVHAVRLHGLAEDYTDELPALQDVERIELHPRVTFFVGENGSGKSTLVEALAVALKLNAEGGGRVQQFAFSTR